VKLLLTDKNILAFNDYRFRTAKVKLLLVYTSFLDIIFY